MSQISPRNYPWNLQTGYWKSGKASGEKETVTLLWAYGKHFMAQMCSTTLCQAFLFDWSCTNIPTNFASPCMSHQTGKFVVCNFELHLPAYMKICNLCHAFYKLSNLDAKDMQIALYNLLCSPWKCMGMRLTLNLQVVLLIIWTKTLIIALINHCFWITKSRFGV